MSTYGLNDLKDKVCVITGGGGVIGASLAKGLGAAGVKIAILDLKKEFADKVAEIVRTETGAVAIGVEANVLDKNSLIEAQKIVLSELGAVDFLINGAGGNSPKATTKHEFVTEELLDKLDETFFGLEMEGFTKVFDLNFQGTLLPTMVFAKEMINHIGKEARMLGQLVTIKYVRTVKKEWMHFGTFVDAHGHFFDTTHFPNSLKNFPFRGDGIYLVLGKIVEEFGFPSMIVGKMAKMPLKKDPRAT